MEKDLESVTLEIPSLLKCPITTQLFFDPVLASDGHIYEREPLQIVFETARAKKQSPLSPMTGLPFENEKITEVAAIRGQSREFVEKLTIAQREKLYNEDEIYLPKSKIQAFAAAIQSGNVGQIKPFINKEADPRLKSMALDQHGNTCIGLACRLQTNPDVLSAIIRSFDEAGRKKLLAATDVTFQYLHDIAKGMLVPGLLAWQDALGVEKYSFFAHCAFYAVARNDIILLQNALMQISIDLEKDSANLLHALVMAISQSKEVLEKQLVYDRLPMIRLLIHSGINTKFKNHSGLTPQELSAKLNLQYLANEIRREAWEYKNRATLEPMKERITDLAEKNERLEREKGELEKKLASQAQQTQQLAQQQRASNHQLVALSRAFRDLVHKREVMEFKPLIMRSFTMGKKLGRHLSLVGNQYLIARYTDQYADDGIVIWDLKQTSNDPIVSLPVAKHDFHSSCEHAVQFAGQNRILYKKPVKQHHQKQSLTLGLFDLLLRKEIRSYDLTLTQIAFMQMTSEDQLFIISGNKECFMLELQSGKMNSFPHLKLRDGSRGSGQVLFAGWPLTSQFLYIKPDQYNTEGLRIYNLAQFQDKQVTVDMPYGISEFDNGIFKILGPALFAFNKADNNNKGLLKLLDLNTGRCIETYSAPTTGTGWNSNTPIIEDICLVGTDKLATIHWAQAQKAKNSGAQIIVWDRASKKMVQSLIIPGKDHSEISIIYDPSADLLYASVQENIYSIKYRAPDMKSEIAALCTDVEELRCESIGLK